MSGVDSPPFSRVSPDHDQQDSLFLRVIRTIDSFSKWSGRLFSFLAVPMMGALVYEVGSRYLLKAPTVWAYDITYMTYGSLFMLGAAYALHRKAHVRTDLIYRLLSVRTQALIDGVLYFTLFFPGMAFFLVKGWESFAYSWFLKEKAMGAWAPPLYPFKAVIPLAALLLIIQGVAELMKCIHAYRRGEWL